MADEGTLASAYEAIGADAAALKVDLPAEEVAVVAERRGFGDAELAAVGEVLAYPAKRHHESTIATPLRLSGLPQKAPKTLGNLDFARMQGRDAAALRGLPALANLHARKDIAFVGPGGIGKTHLAEAYGRECCMRGYKTYFLKASELKDRLERAVGGGTTAKVVSSMVKPSCLIVDEIGRCTFDRACTNLFFDIVDRRYEKEVPNTLILTSNTPVNNWDEFFEGDSDTLVCTLDRIFDKASVYMMRGPSFRGAGCETFSVEAVPSVSKLRV